MIQAHWLSYFWLKMFAAMQIAYINLENDCSFVVSDSEMSAFLAVSRLNTNTLGVFFFLNIKLHSWNGW